MNPFSEQRGRAIVYERSQRTCEVCGRPAHTVHHRVKRGQGGTWDPANLLSVCGDGTRFCHGWIEANPAHAMTLGLWVRSGTDPSTVPAYLHPHSWWRAWWYAESDGCWKWTDLLDGNETPEVQAAIRALTLARLPLPGA
jgi:hypothetical protein